MTDDPSTLTSVGDDIENIGILRIDPGLEPFEDHFKYRVRKYVDQKNLFEKYEGGLEEYAKGNILYHHATSFLSSLTDSLRIVWYFNNVICKI